MFCDTLIQLEFNLEEAELRKRFADCVLNSNPEQTIEWYEETEFATLKNSFVSDYIFGKWDAEDLSMYDISKFCYNSYVFDKEIIKKFIKFVCNDVLKSLIKTCIAENTAAIHFTNLDDEFCYLY